MSYFPINLDDIFSVSNILKASGFTVDIEADASKLVLPTIELPKNCVNGGGFTQKAKLVYDCFNNTVTRKELLEFIEKNISPTSTLVNTLISNSDFFKDRQAYSSTFEWYVGQLMVSEFSAMSSSFGVTVSNLDRPSSPEDTTGDFDVLTILRNLGVACFECKTGSYKRSKILKCVERAVALHCDFVIVFVDAEINENGLKQKLANVRYPATLYNELSVMKSNSIGVKVYRWNDCYFIDSTADITRQINTVLRINKAKKITRHYQMDADIDEYTKLGYECNILLENNF